MDVSVDSAMVFVLMDVVAVEILEPFHSPILNASPAFPLTNRNALIACEDLVVPVSEDLCPVSC